MEEWLQTEWCDWKVYTANITEQLAQVAVVGPNARKVLEKIGGNMDLSAEALPFMAWADGKIGKFDARVYRISFSGEMALLEGRLSVRYAETTRMIVFAMMTLFVGVVAVMVTTLN